MDTSTRIGIAITALLFISISFGVIKPSSDSGRLSRKLSLINAIGWLILLPLPDKGHPPLILFPLVLFWLANLVLVPAAIIALWVSHRDGEEKLRYLLLAGTYVALNLIFLFAIPLLWFVDSIRTS